MTLKLSSTSVIHFYCISSIIISFYIRSNAVVWKNVTFMSLKGLMSTVHLYFAIQQADHESIICKHFVTSKNYTNLKRSLEEQSLLNLNCWESKGLIINLYLYCGGMFLSLHEWCDDCVKSYLRYFVSGIMKACFLGKYLMILVISQFLLRVSLHKCWLASRRPQTISIWPRSKEQMLLRCYRYLSTCAFVCYGFVFPILNNIVNES